MQVKHAENEFNEKHDTQVPIMQQNPQIEPLWNMNFDCSCGKMGLGAGIWLYNPITNQAQGYSYVQTI